MTHVLGGALPLVPALRRQQNDQSAAPMLNPFGMEESKALCGASRNDLRAGLEKGACRQGENHTFGLQLLIEIENP